MYILKWIQAATIEQWEMQETCRTMELSFKFLPYWQMQLQLCLSALTLLYINLSHRLSPPLDTFPSNGLTPSRRQNNQPIRPAYCKKISRTRLCTHTHTHMHKHTQNQTSVGAGTVWSQNMYLVSP